MTREIPTSLWVSALVRRAQLGGAFATIVHRGDAERGDVLLKVTTERGKAKLYGPAFSADGSTAFEQLPAGVDDPAEAQVDEAIVRRLKYDSDLWVIEIEDRDGRHFLTEPVR